MWGTEVMAVAVTTAPAVALAAQGVVELLHASGNFHDAFRWPAFVAGQTVALFQHVSSHGEAAWL